MKKAFSILLIFSAALMLLAIPVFASASPSGEAAAIPTVIPDPSVESAIAAAEAAKAAEAQAPASGTSSTEDPIAERGSASDADASGEASGEASSGFDFHPGAGEFINVFSSALLLPLCFLSIILWFFRAYGMAHENKDNAWLKIYKFLRKIHIPVGAATILLGLYHTIFASINHGWSLNWGSAAMIFFLLGFFAWLFRKSLKRKWVVLHRFTTLIATMCMMIHCAPYLKIVFSFIVPMMLRQLFA